MQEAIQLLHLAQQAAIEAGHAIMEVYEHGNFNTELKEDDSPLTIADVRSHEIILDKLSATDLPILSEESANVEDNERKNWDYYWLVDPLDGTKEFIKKSGDFTVNIALIHAGKPVLGVIYSPVTEALYAGSVETGAYKLVDGITTPFPCLPAKPAFDDLKKKESVIVAASRSHLSAETNEFIKQFKNTSMLSAGSSIKFMLVLEGKADIYPRHGRTMEWDTAAAHAILNAVNRGIYQLDLKNELLYNKPDLGNPHFISF